VFRYGQPMCDTINRSFYYESDGQSMIEVLAIIYAQLCVRICDPVVTALRIPYYKQSMESYIDEVVVADNMVRGAGVPGVGVGSSWPDTRAGR
jgi:hypothetical protein